MEIGLAPDRSFLNVFGGNMTVSGPLPTITVPTIFDYSYSSSTSALYENGSLIGTSNGFTAVTQSSLNIGRRFDNTMYLNGTISEVLIYNRVLSTAERQQVEGYLANKWNLQTYLPAGHPYKTLNMNIGDIYVPPDTTMNPGASTLYYDGSNWSLN